eukprot:TRINITY_DN26373_c0_g1_i10.p1 TRINITY_DN26373_c0_g1~~TRINITY_DN26373_c0_g1_i10.p1  ORF type:complete len:398 (+),score=41.55 TRINITY_DN26373_c0_g1_i10:91-1194(+)
MRSESRDMAHLLPQSPSHCGGESPSPTASPTSGPEDTRYRYLRRASIVFLGVFCTAVALVVIAALICAATPSQHNITQEFVDKYLDGDNNYGHWRLPGTQDPSLLANLTEEFDRTERAPWVTMGEPARATVGYASAKKGIELMYKATKVQGVWDKVPEQFRGVFWMKGNGVGEEIAVLQNGEFFEEAHTMLVPLSPFSWAWPSGEPDKAPYAGSMYNRALVEQSAGVLVRGGDAKDPPASFSFKFSGEDLTEASLQVAYADITKDILGGGAVPDAPDSVASIRVSRFTVEKLPSDSKEPGSSWKRGCFWGIGACMFHEFGSYNLVKVIKGNGEPNEPYYSEFLKYMGDTGLFMWNGFHEKSGAKIEL